MPAAANPAAGIFSIPPLPLIRDSCSPIRARYSSAPRRPADAGGRAEQSVMTTQTASRVRRALAGAVELVERLAEEELIAVRAAPAVAVPVVPRRRPELNRCDMTPWR